MFPFIKILIFSSLIFTIGCNNATDKKSETNEEEKSQHEVDSTEPVETKNWINIQESVSLMNENTTYQEIISTLGKPYDEYVTPSLKEETVMFYNVPGVKGAIYWIMINTETKNFLYWSGEKAEKIRVNNL